MTNQNSNGEKVNKHQATITNLIANTSYNVQVSCTDIEGHKVVAKAGTPSTFLASTSFSAPGATGFITQSQPDTTAPVITVAPVAISISGTQVTITWTTDEIADSQVNYNLSGQALTLTAGDITKVFSHSIVLTNLTPETAYSFTVTSTDPSENPVSSSMISFTTTVLTRTINFDSNGGSTVSSQNIANNSTATEPAAPTKSGSTFAGWYLDVALSLSFSFAIAITGDTTLYGKWTVNSSYAISFQSVGNGTVSCTTPVSSGADSTCTVSPASGYQLATFTDNSVDKTTSVISGSYGITNVTANHAITATFTLIPSAPVNGVCGSCNGGFFTVAPSSNLCLTGTASVLTGTGPWSWSCSGANGGTDMNCSASNSVAPNTGFPISPALQTGQTTCYDAAGAIITCTGTGQDGESQSGLQWPTPRFVDNGDQTQTDKLTGLIWSKDANPAGATKTWQQALDYIKTLNSQNYLGHNDWRLPNRNELESLVNKGQANNVTWLNGQGFTSVQSDDGYWSATSSDYFTNYAWVVVMNYGGGVVDYYPKTYSGHFYVWPVRSGQSGAFGGLILSKTGQTACYDESGATI